MKEWLPCSIILGGDCLCEFYQDGSFRKLPSLLGQQQTFSMYLLNLCILYNQGHFICPKCDKNPEPTLHRVSFPKEKTQLSKSRMGQKPIPSITSIFA